jgi:hypothetical protein
MGKSIVESLRNGRVQIGLALVCCVGVFYGAHLSQAKNANQAASLNAEQLNGTWELQSVGGEPIGPNVESGVISQKMTVAHGKVQGETRLLATSAAATTSMPFPDLSIAHVEESQDGHEVCATWNGTVAILPNDRVELHIGKTQYRLGVHFNPKTLGLELEQDAILTYKGVAKYRATVEMARK